MAGFIAYEDRRVVPRWRTFDKTLNLGELDPVQIDYSHYKISYELLAQKINDWQKYKTVAHATDLVGSASLIIGQTEELNVISAARFLLKDDISASPWSREIARQVLNISDTKEHIVNTEKVGKRILHNQISHFRQLLRIEPKDPITWVELSRTYACLGLREQAQQNMTVALQLAMNNRFVLRSASRLWIYLDDIEKAHHLLLKSDKTPYDPWLLSAEIAIGSISGRTPKLIKPARRMLMKEEFSSEHVSELASALGTLEFLDGSMNKAKKLFRKSLIQPTENSIAQAGWASRRKQGSIHFDDKYLQIPNTFEAGSRIYYHNSLWEDAIQQCTKWQFDQPFSSRPYGYGSYIASVALEDYSRSRQFAEQGLFANPLDFTLMNNLACSLIKNNDMEGARKNILAMQKLQSLSDKEKLVLQATKGLWEFRNGNVEDGRKFYTDALSRARKIKDRRLIASASIFYALEETSQEYPDQSVISEAFHNMEQVHDPIFRVLEHRLSQVTE